MHLQLSYWQSMYPLQKCLQQTFLMNFVSKYVCYDLLKIKYNSMYCGLLPVMHRFDAYSSTSYSRGIRRLPSPEVCRMASDVCQWTTSGSDNNNPHSNVNNNMTTSNVFDFKQYEVDKMYSPQCERETLYCYNNARSIKRHSLNFERNFDRKFPESLDTRNIH